MVAGNSDGGFRGGGVTQAEFKLDTKRMNDAIEKCEELVKTMRDLRSELEKTKNDLLFSWAGYGRNECEKKYRILNQQFTDMIDDTWAMYEDLKTAEEAYIQADVNYQKTLEGVDRKF